MDRERRFEDYCRTLEEENARIRDACTRLQGSNETQRRVLERAAVRIRRLSRRRNELGMLLPALVLACSAAAAVAAALPD